MNNNRDLSTSLEVTDFVHLFVISTEANKSDYKGGVFLGFALGYDFGHFEIAAQYLYTQVDTKDKIRTGFDDYSYSAKWNLYHMGVSLGIAF